MFASYRKSLGLFVLCLALVGCKSRVKVPHLNSAFAVARVGNQIITGDQLMKKIHQIEKETPQVLSTHLQKKSLLEQMINIDLIYKETVRTGFKSLEKSKNKIAEDFVLSLADKAANSLTHQNFERYYKAHHSEYDEISARHILFLTSPSMSSEKRKQIYERLLKIRKELLKSPEKFAEYAKRYSEDSTARSGGNLGFFNFKRMVAPFSEAAFKLKQNNEISPIVQTRFGYHLIQLTGDKRGFKYHEKFIEHDLIEKKKTASLTELIRNLRKKTKVEVYNDQLLKLSPLPKEMLTDPNKILPKGLKANE